MVRDGKGKESEKGLFGRLGSAKGANIRISRDACGDAIIIPVVYVFVLLRLGNLIHILQILPLSVM